MLLIASLFVLHQPRVANAARIGFNCRIDIAYLYSLRQPSCTGLFLNRCSSLGSPSSIKMELKIPRSPFQHVATQILQSYLWSLLALCLSSLYCCMAFEGSIVLCRLRVAAVQRSVPHATLRRWIRRLPSSQSNGESWRTTEVKTKRMISAIVHSPASKSVHPLRAISISNAQSRGI